MPSTAQSAMVSVNGIDMYYQLLGKGEPLLILHGFTGSGEDLVNLFGDLSSEFQVIIPDLRGHGHSTNPSKQFTFEQAALDVIGLLEHLNIPHCKAIGFSGGGIVLLKMAYAKPELVKSMILVSAASYFPKESQVIMKQYASAEITPEQWQFLRKIHFHGDEQIKLLCGYPAKFGDDPADPMFTPEMLSTIKTKTLVVQGDNDPIYPLSMTIEMYRSLPNANLWILPNSGHGPINADNLEMFKAYAVQYL